jgi:hypothetical protein
MKLLGFFLSLAYSSWALGEIYRIDDKSNTRFWSFGIGLENHNYGTEEMPIEGMAQVTSLGYGNLQEKYFWKVGGFLSNGPIRPVFAEKLILDSSSKGLNFLWGYSLFTPSMRSSFSSGPLLGLRQVEFSSETLGSREETTVNSKRNYSLKTKYSSLSLEAGLFYCKALAARPTGNRPDLLVTRVESWNLHLSAVLPLFSKFNGTLETSDGSALIDSKSPRQRKNLSSKLKGYSILLNLDTWFGG